MQCNSYRSRLRQSKCRLLCDRCDEDHVLRSAPDRERHAFVVHGLRSGIDCPWCWTRFLDAGKAMNVGHLSRCFELLVFEQRAAAAAAAIGAAGMIPFRCCGLELDVRGFDAHVRSVHCRPLDDDCVWCGDRGTNQRHRRECLDGRPEFAVVVPDPKVLAVRVAELEADLVVRDAEVRTLRDRVSELVADKRRYVAREAADCDERRQLREQVAELEADKLREAAECGERRQLRERVAELEADKMRDVAQVAADCGERRLLRERVAELEATLRDLRKDSVRVDVVSALRLKHAEFVSTLKLEYAELVCSLGLKHAAFVERIRSEHRAELKEGDGRVRALLEERFSTVVRLLEERIDGHVEEKRDLAERNRALTAEAGDLNTQVGGLFAGLVSLLRTVFGGDPVVTKRMRVEDGV